MQSILKAGDVGLMIKGFIEELRIIRAGYLLSYELDLTNMEGLKKRDFFIFVSLCGDAGAVKRAGLKNLWLSAFGGSNPPSRI